MITSEHGAVDLSLLLSNGLMGLTQSVVRLAGTCVELRVSVEMINSCLNSLKKIMSNDFIVLIELLCLVHSLRSH